MVDLATEYLGLKLSNPLVPSSSPLTGDAATARRLEDAGAAAIVMPSLFEEEVRQSEESVARFLHEQAIGFGEADSFLPIPEECSTPLDEYLELLSALKASLDIPVIASLNGVTAGGWMNHATEIADAGADALELNAYYVAGDVWEEGHYVEQRYITLLHELREHVQIPINMKISPFFSSIGNLVKKLEATGLAGVTLFNRFFQPDIDIDGMRLTHTLTPTRSSDALLAMRWIAILHGRVECSLGATGGVHNADDAIKLLLAGADVVHLCHALLQHGSQHLGKLIGDVSEWMERQGFERIEDFRGRMSQSSVLDPSEYERLNYIRVIEGHNTPDGVWR